MDSITESHRQLRTIWISLLILSVAAVAGQIRDPYAAATATIQDPGRTRVANGIINFGPTQSFFIAGLGSDAANSAYVPASSLVATESTGNHCDAVPHSCSSMATGATVWRASQGFNGLATFAGSNVFLPHDVTTSTLQSIINSNCNGITPGSILLPNQLSTIIATISLPNYCVLRGTGPSSGFSYSHGPVVTFAGSNPTGIELHDLTIDGGSSVSSSYGIYGFGSGRGQPGINHIVIDNVTFQNIGGQAIYFGGTAASPGDNIIIRNSHIINSGVACNTSGSVCTTAGQTQLAAANLSNINHLTIDGLDISGSGLTYGLVLFGPTPTSCTAAHIPGGYCQAAAIHDVSIHGLRVHDIGQIMQMGGTGFDVARIVNLTLSGSDFNNIASGQCWVFESLWNSTASGNTCNALVIPNSQSAVAIVNPSPTVIGEVGTQNVHLMGNTVTCGLASGARGASCETVNGSYLNVSLDDALTMNTGTSIFEGILVQPGSSDSDLTATGWTGGSELDILPRVTDSASLSGNRAIGIEVEQQNSGVAANTIKIHDGYAKGFNEGLAWSARANNGITNMSVTGVDLTGNNTSASGDLHTYSTLYLFNDIGVPSSMLAGCLTLNGQGNAFCSGSGAPTGNCSVGSLHTNSSASSVSTALYICYPANKWTALSVP
jgi:hypothetical protein